MRCTLKIVLKNVNKRGYLQDATIMGKILKYISRKLVGVMLRIEIQH
jgi:hypothetical protein